MSLDNVMVEVFSNLQCAYVILQFRGNKFDPIRTKIVVAGNSLEIYEETIKTRLKFDKYFSIREQQYTNYRSDGSSVTLRLLIKNIQDTGCPLAVSKKDARLRLALIGQPLFLENMPISLLCRNCSHELVTDWNFEKIRKYPSGAIDFEDFFCHHGPNLYARLVPDIADFFHTFYFAILNMKLLQANLRAGPNQHLYCKQCGSYLGNAMLNGSAAKIWADTLTLKIDERMCDVFNISGVEPTHLLLEKAISETAVKLRDSLFSTKIVIEVEFPEAQRKYILISFIDSTMCVLRNKSIINYNHTILMNNGKKDQMRQTEVELEQSKCFKLLYRTVDTISPLPEPPPVTTPINKDLPISLTDWKPDLTTYMIQVSPGLFSALLDDLLKNSLLVPAAERNAQNGFQLSYIFY